MGKVLLLVTAIIIGGFSMKMEGKEDGSYLRDITMEYETAHLEWASTLSEGKIRVLFIVTRKGGREIVETAQRIGLDFTALTAYSRVQLAYEDTYESAVEGTTVFEKTNELLQKLEGAYDLIILGNVMFDNLPQEAQFKILCKVSDGAGLIMTWGTDSRLKKIFSKPVDGADEILSMSPLKGLPSPLAKTSAGKLVKTYAFGKGRIAAINYVGFTDNLSLTAMNTFSRSWQAEYENNLVLVMRAMLWAAGKNPKIKVSCPELAASPELDRKPLSIGITVAGGNASADVKARLRNEHNDILSEKKLKVADGKAVFESAAMPAGKYFLDLITSDGKGVDNFGYFCFSIKSPVGAAKVETGEKDSFKPGEKINCAFEMETPLTGKGQLEIRLADSPYGRIWLKDIVEVQPGQKKVEFKLENIQMPTISAYLECVLRADNLELCKTDKLLFFPKRNKDIYTQIVWNCVPEGLSPFYASQVVDNLGWSAALNHPSPDGENAKAAAIFNQRFVTYITRIGLISDKKIKGVKQYGWFFLPAAEQKTVEKIDDQSFYNPEIRNLWAKGIENRIKNLPKYGPAVYNLGDENAFAYGDTFSVSDEIEFRKFLKNRYDGKTSVLNAIWGTDYKTFDEISTSIKEANDKKMFPAWFDVRLFWEKQYADIHHFLADEIKKRDPEAIVGAEGSVPGNLEQTISRLEFWGPYSDTVMDEVLRSIGGDRLRTLWWGGYVGGMHYGRNNLPTPLWKFLLTGTVNGSAWYSASVAGNDGMLGADMRYADYFKGMRPHLDDLRNGVAQLLIKTPQREDGIAVLYSHASDSANLLDPRLVNPKDSAAAFIKFCHSQGLNLDFLTESGMSDKLKKYKVLFLFGASAVSTEEAARITQFVKDGGTVVADVNPGLLDGFLKPAEKNMLEPLFGNLTFAGVKNPELAKISIDKAVNGVKIKFEAEKGLTTPGLPFMQVKEFGKGRAILLNFSFASAKNTACDAGAFSQFLKSLLASEKITPYAKLDGVEDESLIFRVREGNGFKLVGILCGKNDTGKTATLSIPGTSYVYEVNRGFLKKCDSWSFKFDVPFKLFALYEKEQKAPEFSLSSKDATAGKTLLADISKILDGSVLYVQLKGPDGTALPLRDKVVLVDKKTRQFDLPFAYSDKPGKYSVVVKNVNTGLESKEDLVLK